MSAELNITGSYPIVSVSTKESFQRKKVQKYPIPLFIIFGLSFALFGASIKQSLILAFLLTTFFSLLFYFFNWIGTKMYTTLNIDFDRKQIIQKKNFFNQSTSKTISLEDGELFIRDVSRSGLVKGILTFLPEDPKKEQHSFMVVTGKKQIETLCMKLRIGFKPKKNPQAFFNN